MASIVTFGQRYVKTRKEDMCTYDYPKPEQTIVSPKIWFFTHCDLSVKNLSGYRSILKSSSVKAYAKLHQQTKTLQDSVADHMNFYQTLLTLCRSTTVAAVSFWDGGWTFHIYVIVVIFLTSPAIKLRTRTWGEVGCLYVSLLIILVVAILIRKMSIRRCFMPLLRNFMLL